MERKMPKALEKTLIVAILLVAAVFVVLFTHEGNDSAAAEFVYTVKEDGYASIEGYTGDKAKLEIPEKVGENGEYTVKYISAEAFTNKLSLKKITIPSTVEKIDRYAFSGCTNLREAVLSENLIEIGYGAFFKCEKLKKIVLPETLKKIDDSAFEDCKHLKNLYIPSACGEIGTDAFLGCENLVLDCGENDVARAVADQYRIPTSFKESHRATLLNALIRSLIIIILAFGLRIVIIKIKAKKNKNNS